MAIETNFEKVRLDCLKKIGDFQQVVGSGIDLSAKGGIKKLLTAAAKVKITGTEALTGEIKLAGRINYKLIYVDGEGALKSSEYSSDFNESIRDDSVKASEPLYCRACITDVDSASIGDEIKLQTVVDMALYAVETRDFEALTGITGALKKCRETETQTFAGGISDSFELSEEIETGVDVNDIIVAEAAVAISGVKAETKRIAVSGDVKGAVVYESGGVYTSKCFSLPFCETLDAPGAQEGTEVSVDAFIRECRVAITGIEGNNIVRLEVSVGVKAPVFLSANVNLITDVCSPEYEIDADKKDFDFVRYAFSRCFTEKVSGNAELGENMESIRRILFCVPLRNYTANVIPAAASFTAEGLLQVGVIYEDEEDALCSVTVELPYSLCFDSESVNGSDILECICAAGCVTAKVRRDREIEVVAELNFDVRVNKPVAVKYISEVSVGEEHGAQLKGIGVYVCEAGETLWDAAKALMAPVEEIAAQNGLDADVVFAGGEKVIFYRELNVG